MLLRSSKGSEIGSCSPESEDARLVSGVDKILERRRESRGFKISNAVPS